ncbi:MAG: hypothetical protein PQJ58_18090 [Spirochaetales bacterium]|nr:hypothetical protein [Spirochaetales bacterium]
MQAVWIVAIAVGIPVLSGTVTRISKLYFANKEKERSMNISAESEALEDIQAGMRDLKRRIANLESILLEYERKNP